MSTDLTPGQAAIVSRLVDLSARIAALSEEAEGLKAELRALPAGEYGVDGRTAVSIVPTRRFDAAAALAAVPAERRQECIKVDPDAAAIKRLLSPEQVESFMVVTGKPKVVLQ